MGFGICLQLVLVGHALADFYLQSDAMARHKGVDHRVMAEYGLAYAACVAVVVLAFRDCQATVPLATAAGGLMGERAPRRPSRRQS